jgi:uncharacterized membrane protein
MPTADLVQSLLRWLHIMAAATMIGGTVFIWIALLPALLQIDESIRVRLHSALRMRWSKVVMTAIGLLLLTGLVNFFLTNAKYDFKGTSYHMLFGIKFLIAVIIFFIASAITGRSALAEKMRQQAALWLGINLLLVMIVVALSGGLKVTRENAPRKTGDKPNEPTSLLPTQNSATDLTAAESLQSYPLRSRHDNC